METVKNEAIKINFQTGKDSYNNAFPLQELMIGNNLLLIYRGQINDHITHSVLTMAEKNMEKNGEENLTKKRVFNVMVECLQNIAKHADDPDNQAASKYNSIFLIGHDEDGYYIISGNVIYGNKVQDMERRLNLINSLDKESLKSHYMKIMASNDLTDKGGASLGFVEMARKSGNQLKFSFEAIDSESQFFVLQTSVMKKKVA